MRQRLLQFLDAGIGDLRVREFEIGKGRESMQLSQAGVGDRGVG